jgi:hypothetical protein
LEPSAGQGALADLITNRDAVTTIELNPLNCAVLRNKGYSPIQTDFLAWRDGEYDLIPMNPPFSSPQQKNVYIDHIMHAWSMLAEYGHIVAITPVGWLYNNTKAISDFRDLVFQNGSYEKLPENAFAASGTNVNTCIIALSKDHDARKREMEPILGHPNDACYQLYLAIFNNGDLYRQLCKTAMSHETLDALRSAFDPILRDAIKKEAGVIRESGYKLWYTGADEDYLINTISQEFHSNQ